MSGRKATRAEVATMGITAGLVMLVSGEHHFTDGLQVLAAGAMLTLVVSLVGSPSRDANDKASSAPSDEERDPTPPRSGRD